MFVHKSSKTRLYSNCTASKQKQMGGSSTLNMNTFISVRAGLLGFRHSKIKHV
jgi:hypothetical protein